MCCLPNDLISLEPPVDSNESAEQDEHFLADSEGAGSLQSREKCGTSYPRAASDR